MKKIGIDVGGTNTDAVLLLENEVIASVKVPTSDDVTSGLGKALAALTKKAEDLSGLDAVIVGTTHFINAVVQRKGLAPIAALRIGTPASRSIPPYCDWPEELAQVIDRGVWSVSGGHEFDGSCFTPLDVPGIRSAVRKIRDLGVTSVAVSSVFSPVNAEHELEAAAIIGDACPDIQVTCSSSLGRIGLLERENVAMLNAALCVLAERVTTAISAAVREQGLFAPVYLSRNDGTIATIEDTIKQPVYSFASGATNSMRGGAFLSGVKEAIVVDVGGTTTDVGLLQNGFPHEANSVVKIGGVRTLFRMPDVLSIGLGGGSLVGEDGTTVGPHSVGNRLANEALVFGGTTLTSTDVAVAAGLADIGDDIGVSGISYDTQRAFRDTCGKLLTDVIDRVKIKSGALPLIAVGGAAFLVPDGLEGTSEILRVAHAECANAVGAALAQVSGEIDHIYNDVPRAESLEDAERQAAERAVAAGADEDSLELIDLEEMPLAYLPGNAVRVRARVVGEMKRIAAEELEATTRGA
ncbi:MAG: hydantoinase/oxoprolinase family protein [Rhodospirillales bacterium]|nr:hydantoinase/oxoprolinase family protein [Rhodospirillales bacterium]